MDLSSPRDTGLDDLIGAIYDCVIDPSLWRDTVDRIRRRYGFHNAVLGVTGASTNKVILNIAVNIPDAMLSILVGYGPDLVEVWGGWERLAATPLEEPRLNSELRPPDWADNPYFRDFAVPQGIVDAVAIVLEGDQRTIANIAFGIHHSTPPVTEAVLDELRILAPHLRRAVAIGRLLEDTIGAAASFADALDAAAAGVVLVDGAQRVVHANRAASDMLSAGDPIRVAGGRLELATELAPGAFRRAVETAGEASSGSKGIGVPARRLNGDPLTVQAMPLERRRGSNTPSAAVAAVFISEATRGPANSPDILAALFDLTPAESRIFTLVAAGGELAEIAEQLSISPWTVKTHLRRIYHKTGRKSRAGLVRLARDIAPPG